MGRRWGSHRDSSGSVFTLSAFRVWKPRSWSTSGLKGRRKREGETSKRWGAGKAKLWSWELLVERRRWWRQGDGGDKETVEDGWNEGDGGEKEMVEGMAVSCVGGGVSGVSSQGRPRRPGP